LGASAIAAAGGEWCGPFREAEQVECSREWDDRLGGEFVLVQQSAEPVATAQPIEL
jgi:hypothetical protein